IVNTAASQFGNFYEGSGNEAWFRFELTEPGEVMVHTFNSVLSVVSLYFYSIDQQGNLIDQIATSHDSYLEYEGGNGYPYGTVNYLSLYHGRTQLALPAGEFIFFAEGEKISNLSQNNGQIQLTFHARAFGAENMALHIPAGMDPRTGYELGRVTMPSSRRLSRQDNLGLWNNHGSDGVDMHYIFSVEESEPLFFRAGELSGVEELTIYKYDKSATGQEKVDGRLIDGTFEWELTSGDYLLVVGMDGSGFDFKAEGAKFSLDPEPKPMDGKRAYSAVELGVYDSDFSVVTDLYDTREQGFIDFFMNTGKDLWFRLILEEAMVVDIHNFGSPLPGTGITLFHRNEDGINDGPLIATVNGADFLTAWSYSDLWDNNWMIKGCIRVPLPPGAYLIMVDGYDPLNTGVVNGPILTTVHGVIQ
ncbi:MAG: hypothetical protein LUE10_04805, partial [Alistipes sp.]|nr:hypothetical protein [Alistipes sp.]